MEIKVEDRIKNVMSLVFDMPPSEISENASADTIELWDSLKHMNMVAALEEEFEVKFSDDEIIEMMNYPLIKQILKDNLK